ncbi:hypothetical protein [Nocardia sputorum]|uniref:Uncharacterized protein n=1 Tax=Nocardia sputorum TaxID=2984338 RepID=A0ABN6U4J8_9NOCA|nr:hypothetical protein [Nocardia sputorum]BDU00090.1 hypothetical protein IFM12276_31180 [Nocardia sputorum]
MTAGKCHPSEGDVQVRIWLAGEVFDFVATASAARSLFCDSRRKDWCAMELIHTTAEDLRLLPRLPCERLFAPV